MSRTPRTNTLSGLGVESASSSRQLSATFDVVAIPSKFEELLSAGMARRYMPVRFSVRRALIEATCSPEKLSDLLGEDMKHFHHVRAAIGAALSSQPEKQSAAALMWKSFLRSRVEMLDYWSAAFAAFTAFFAAVLGVGVVVMRPTGLDYLYLIAAGLGTSVFSILKFQIDRQKSWYKYLVSHLEAIQK